MVIGALVLVIGFFYNEEAIPMPLRNTLFGGELFFAFVVSFVLAVAGLVAEWLMQSHDNSSSAPPRPSGKS
jgi:hypothetical protein